MATGFVVHEVQHVKSLEIFFSWFKELFHKKNTQYQQHAWSVRPLLLKHSYTNRFNCSAMFYNNV